MGEGFRLVDLVAFAGRTTGQNIEPIAVNERVFTSPANRIGRRRRRSFTGPIKRIYQALEIFLIDIIDNILRQKQGWKQNPHLNNGNPGQPFESG